MRGVSSDDLGINRANWFPEINIDVYFRVYVYVYVCVYVCVYVPWQAQLGFRFCAVIAAVAAVKRPTSTRRCTASTCLDFSRARGSCGSFQVVSGSATTSRCPSWKEALTCVTCVTRLRDECETGHAASIDY